MGGLFITNAKDAFKESGTLTGTCTLFIGGVETPETIAAAKKATEDQAALNELAAKTAEIARILPDGDHSVAVAETQEACQKHFIPGDRRTCLAVRIERQVCEVRTLSGYDAKKNRWGEYCSPKGDFTFPDKRGLKALREWIQVRAQETTGYPNPEFLTIYSAPAETVKPRDGELFARPGAAD
jgi:hypothetical protein